MGILLCFKSDIDLSPGNLDDGDIMRLEDFNLLMEFYNTNKTLKVSDEDLILEVFKYFVSRDMILEASLMQTNLEGLEEGTLLQEEEATMWNSINFQIQKCFIETIKARNRKMYRLLSKLLKRTV